MPLYGYDADEWYPVISIVKDAELAYNDERAEFADEEVERIKLAFAEFRKVQELIREKFGMGKVPF